MVMTALREGASGGIFKYFLLGILVMAGAGLIFMDIGGFFRGGVTSTDAAKVGDHTIPLNSFDRIVRSSTQRLGMTPAQAYQLGYIRELLNGEVRTTLLQLEASDMGIRVGDRQVAQNIQRILQPMTQPGQQQSDVLQQLLRSQGMTEAGLAAAIRREMTVNNLGNAIQSGFLTTSDLMVEDMAIYNNETRNIEYILFKDEDFTDVNEPDESALRTFYEAIKESYATPEMRTAQIVIINTDNLEDSLEISEEEIKDIYERNISAYSEPEKREIEQAILADREEAAAIAEAVKGGQSLNDAVESVTGNTTDYLPPKAEARGDLLNELREPVFTAKTEDVIGPLESGLGHHVIVLKSIQEARTTPLEEVAQDIREELTDTRLLDAQYDLANSVDDYLAAGEDLVTIQEELGVEIEDFPPSNAFGTDKDGKAVFTAAFGPDTQDIVTTLFDLPEGEASPVRELADGRMASVVLKSIQDKSYPPFEELEETLKTRWMNDSRSTENRLAVMQTLKEATENESSLQEIAKAQGQPITKATKLKRDGQPTAPLTQTVLENIFNAQKNTMLILNLDGGTAIAQIKDISLDGKINDDAHTAAENTLLQSLQNEAYTIYVNELQNEYGVSINNTLLETIYGQQDTQ